MSEALLGGEQEVKTGLSDEQMIAVRGLRVLVNPSVWEGWSDAMPSGPGAVEVAAARIELDPTGEPVAFGLRYSEMLRAIAEFGRPDSHGARLIGLQPNRIMMINADGTGLWTGFPVDLAATKEVGDP